jgi:hypothetical protein
VTFSHGVASNIEAGADEIERLRKALREVMKAENDPYEVARLALSQTNGMRETGGNNG